MHGFEKEIFVISLGVLMDKQIYELLQKMQQLNSRK